MVRVDIDPLESSKATVAELLRGDDNAGMYEVHVLRSNAQSVRVYQHCQLSYLAGGAGVLCIGISAMEATAAMNALDIPSKARKAILRNVFFMGSVAADYLNAQSKKGS